MSWFINAAIAFIGIASVSAAPTALEIRDGITALTASAVAAFKPYTQFASVAYCSPSQTVNWTCGPRCEELPGFIPYGSGGDGDNEQFCVNWTQCFSQVYLILFPLTVAFKMRTQKLLQMCWLQSKKLCKLTKLPRLFWLDTALVLR